MSTRYRMLVMTACMMALAVPANAVVFLNEVFINPPGSLDATQEYIELMGTPGKKLDGYAIAFTNGMQKKLYPLNSIPPYPEQEFDEFFSLDGLSLGANGILVIGNATSPFYSTLLTDSNFQNWDSIWNGGLDTPGKLENDGSNTVFLIRNRPGSTEANPNLSDLRWGKDVLVDAEVVRPVEDPEGSGNFFDQFGNGSVDKGEPNNIGGNTADLRGFTTPDDVLDDLEIVDEFSYEHDQGWEYDLDNRKVDAGICVGGTDDGSLCEDNDGCGGGGMCVGGSTLPGLPPRNVHAFDDPQGFNPDIFTRVDYRTKGPGWTPANGGTGAGPSGNNPQDTATEQWIRGESVTGSSGEGNGPWMFFDNSANANTDSIQPHLTNVPLWLADGVGDDYDFSSLYTYQIMAGRINPLATAFIPGDSDRDGDADSEDIDKIAAVFGDDDWIFSNSFATAPEGKAGDPASQTRPWDVNATGDNGIEPSDLQWTLNFQGETTGQIVGRQYDSTAPASTGVHLSSNAAVGCTVTASANVPGPRSITTLKVGDLVEFVVAGQVTSGANTTADQQNGIMQVVNDLDFATAGVLQVISVEPASPFQTTRAAIQTLQGTNGRSGIHSVNAYTTSFTQGLSSPASLYKVTCRAAGIGTTDVTVSPASLTGFAASTPLGLKVGHTDNNGNPASASYPSALNAVVLTTVLPDFDADGDVDTADYDHFATCATGPEIAQNSPSCQDTKLDGDADVDQSDFGILQRCFSGEDMAPAEDCDILP
jgi:hypothetical protein